MNNPVNVGNFFSFIKSVNQSYAEKKYVEYGLNFNEESGERLPLRELNSNSIRENRNLFSMFDKKRKRDDTGNSQKLIKNKMVVQRMGKNFIKEKLPEVCFLFKINVTCCGQ